MSQSVHTVSLRKLLRGSGPGRYRIDRTHGDRRLCPACGADCMVMGLPDIACTYEICTCRNGTSYDHLVEQLWCRVHVDRQSDAGDRSGVAR